MRSVRIVADDLTGALDAAAPFAMADGPLPIVWNAQRAGARRGSVVLDLESRDADPPPDDAWVGTLAGADVAFKKLDSLLRGRPAEELRACVAGGRFRSAVIAPAFPAQRRVTRAGRQHWRAGDDEPWRPVERDLAGELRALGVGVRMAGSPGDLTGAGAFLCDATTEDDLAALADAGRRLEPPVLWAGTAGLAHALAGPSRHTVPKPAAPLLIVVGSRHPVARAQLDALATARPDALVRVRSIAQAPDRIRSELALRLAGGPVAALAFDFPQRTSTADADRTIEGTLSDLVRHAAPPRSLVVTGGATLFALMRASAAGSLRVHGELLPGVACSTIAGGGFDGALVVSKSGAFGDAGTLVYLTGLLEAPAND